MTFDNDIMQFEMLDGPRRVYCKTLGVEWPPPARYTLLGFEFVRVSLSSLTDAQRADTPHVMRGARYTLAST